MCQPANERLPGRLSSAVWNLVMFQMANDRPNLALIWSLSR